MPTAICDGIRTRYEVLGDGPPLLLFSPGGFNAIVENWWSFGIYERLDLLEHLSRRFQCVAYDRREAGRSGGRVERITWSHYVAQGVALLDHLGVARAHVMGGCIGCSIAVNAAVAHADRVESLVLYAPAGGPAYLATQRGRFAAHLEFVDERGLAGVVELARGSGETFAQDPRVGPWVSVLRTDERFAAEYVRLDVDRYRALVRETAQALFDREAVPGADPEQLTGVEVPALVVPGDDPNHATSAARHLAELLPGAQYWDVLPPGQTEETAPVRVLEFLGSVR